VRRPFRRWPAWIIGRFGRHPMVGSRYLGRTWSPGAPVVYLLAIRTGRSPRVGWRGPGCLVLVGSEDRPTDAKTGRARGRCHLRGVFTGRDQRSFWKRRQVDPAVGRCDGAGTRSVARAYATGHVRGVFRPRWSRPVRKHGRHRAMVATPIDYSRSVGLAGRALLPSGRIWRMRFFCPLHRETAIER